MPNQPRMKEVQLHEYTLHLIRYYDNTFVKNPHFPYYIYNLMMWDQSQATTSVYVKTKIANRFPTSIVGLNMWLE